MPYFPKGMRMRRGVGQFATATLGPAGTGIAQYDASGRYLGGSGMMDWYCGSSIGQTLSPATCAIPTPAQITASQTAELATTSAPTAAQLAAIAAGNAIVAEDAATNPANYQQQIAASNWPQLSSLIGPSAVATLFPVDVTDPNNPQPQVPWLMIALIIAGVSALYAFGGRR